MSNVKSELRERLTNVKDEEFERNRPKKQKLFDGNCAQKLLFTNLTKMVKRGEKKAYSTEDLFDVSREFKYRSFQKFEKFTQKKGSQFRGNFLKLIITFFAKDLRWPMFLSALRYLIDFPTPVILRLFLTWMQQPEPEMTYGYLYAGLLGFCLIAGSYLQTYIDYTLEARLAAKIRNNCRGLIINRVSSLDPGAYKYIDIGKVSTNISVDVEKLAYYLIFRPHIYVSLRWLILLYGHSK